MQNFLQVLTFLFKREQTFFLFPTLCLYVFNNIILSKNYMITVVENNNNNNLHYSAFVQFSSFYVNLCFDSIGFLFQFLMLHALHSLIVMGRFECLYVCICT